MKNIGIITYEFITGNPPFEDSSFASTTGKISEVRGKCIFVFNIYNELIFILFTV